MSIAEIFKDAGLIAGSFVAGSIPFCYLLGRIVGKKRLTEIGDRNPGGWNLVFNVSKIWGTFGIFLDMAKGYFAYFLAEKFAFEGSTVFIGTSHNQLIAVLAGCAAITGHNYSPFLKFKGGKGLATWGGFMSAVPNPNVLPMTFNWINFLAGAIGLLAGLVLARNMIWAVSLGIIFTGFFLFFSKGSAIYLFAIILILIIMLPRQINNQISLSGNFKFRKEATLQDLFRPKIR